MRQDELEKILFAPPEQSAEWIAASARYGLVEAQVLLGQMLLDGTGLQRNPKAAFAWFSVAANAGHLPAINMVGRCHQNGWGTKPDHAAALTHFHKAAERGEPWSQFNLGDMLLRAGDRDSALVWLRRAARQGHAKAMNILGMACEQGWEQPATASAALGWYHEAAQRGDFRAQFNVATILMQNGRIEESALWFSAALRSENPDITAASLEQLADRDEPVLMALHQQARALATISQPTHTRQRAPGTGCPPPSRGS